MALETPMRVFRALFFGLIVVAALFALLFLLPWLKEGYAIEELPLFAAIAAGCLAAAALWWLANRRSHSLLRPLGFAALAVPFCAYVALGVQLVVNEWRGRRLAKTVRIVALRETDITWLGLDGPAGVQLELELEHAVGLEGNLFPPKLVMGSDPRPTYRDYFFGAMDRGVDATLELPVFDGGPSTPRDVLLRPGRRLIRYELFPSVLERRDGPAICLSDRTPRFGERGRLLPDGGDLGAAWFFAASGGVIVDMSAPLTEALRRSSGFQGRPEEWRRMMLRLQPRALEAAGFRRCDPRRAGSYEICYCPSVAPRPS